MPQHDQGDANTLCYVSPRNSFCPVKVHGCVQVDIYLGGISKLVAVARWEIDNPVMSIEVE